MLTNLPSSVSDQVRPRKEDNIWKIRVRNETVSNREVFPTFLESLQERHRTPKKETYFLTPHDTPYDFILDIHSTLATGKTSFNITVTADHPTDYMNGEYNVETKRIKGIRHEIIMAMLTRRRLFESDVPLNEIRHLGDDGDRLSPDYLDRDLKIYAELKTTGNFSLSDRYDRAHSKYYRPIKDRDEDYDLRVLVVSSEKIVTNSVAIKEIDTLSKMFLTGVALHYRFLDFGVMMESKNEEKDKFYKDLHEHAKKDLHEKSKGFIDQTMVDHWRASKGDSSKYISECLEDANESFLAAKEKLSSDQVDKEISSHKEHMFKVTNPRNDVNTAFKFPLVSLKEEKESHPIVMDSTMHEMGKLWSAAISKKIRMQDAVITTEEREEMESQLYTGIKVPYSGGEFFGKKEEIRASLMSDLKEQIKESARRREERLESRIKDLKTRKIEQKNQAAFDDIFQVENKQQEENLKSSVMERTKAYRIDLSTELNFYPEVRKHIAERGVQGKDQSGKDYMKKKHENQKRCFELGTDTSDILDHLKDHEWWFAEADANNLYLNERMESIYNETLRTLAPDLRQSLDEEWRFINDFSRTRISAISSSIDRILEEVSISLTHYTRKDEFILKKIPKIDAYLLIKTTRPDRKIFYSLMCRKKDVINYKDSSMTFMKPIDYDGMYVIYEFCSFDRHRLSHNLFTTEYLCSLKSHTDGLFDAFSGEFKVPNTRSARMHLLFSFFMCLDSKTKTIEHALLSRYAYMEAAKVSPTVNRPWKIMKKFSPLVHSRFGIFVTSRIFECIELMSKKEITPLAKMKNLEIEDSKDLSRELHAAAADEFDGLISFVTMESITNYDMALFLSYLGVTKNKDEGDVRQGDFKIFVKIAEEERKMKFTREEYLGRSEGRAKSLRPHEFSYSYVRDCGRRIREYIDKKKGGSFSTWFKDSVFNTMKKKRMEEFATLKSSAVKPNKYDHASMSGKMNKKVRALENLVALMAQRDLDKTQDLSFGSFCAMLETLGDFEEWDVSEEMLDQDIDELNIRMQRIKKAEEEIYEHCLKFVTNSPLIQIGDIIDMINNTGGIWVSTFKKQQLSGPREIFILSMLSRLGIAFVESISRLLCEELPMEMLTKGSEKIKRTEQHFSEMRAEKHRRNMPVDITGADSDDKTTWCQGFTMPLFACLYSGILDLNDKIEMDVYMNICQVLNLVADKKIELPDPMLKDFKDTSKKDSYDPKNVMNEMKRQFIYKAGDHDLIDQDRIFMKNLSNMMQGILHYTSSLLHAGHALNCSNICERLVRSWIEAYFPGQMVYMNECWKVSSDDSSVLRSMLITINCTHRELATMKLWSVHVISLMSFLSRELARMACMTHSDVKSTSPNFSGIEEFNSYWMINNVIISPTIKFIYAALRPKVTSMMEDRIRIFAELRKQVLENNGSLFTTSVLMINQMFIHYKLMGVNTNKWWDIFWDHQTKLKHPSLGFFPFEIGRSVGLFGYQKAFYDLYINNSETRLTNKWIYENKGLDVSEDGKPSIKISLQIGSKSRYKMFLDRLGIPFNYEAIMEKRPYLIFKNPEDLIESLFFIYSKAKNPSSAEAFSFQAPSKMHAASVFILDKASVMYRKKFGKDWGQIHLSMVGICMMALQQINEYDKFEIKPIGPSTDLKEEEKQVFMSMLFPLHDQYDEINKILVMFSGTQMRYNVKKLSNKQVDIQLSNVSSTISKTLYQWLGPKWFPLQVKRTYTSSENEYCEKFYKATYPWIKDKYEDTINDPDFPFNGIITMANFIKSVDSSPGIVKVISPAYRSSPLYKRIYSVIKFGYVERHILHGQNIVELDNKNLKITNLKKIYSSFLCSPDCLRPDSLKLLKEKVSSIQIDPVTDIKYLDEMDTSVSMIRYVIDEIGNLNSNSALRRTAVQEEREKLKQKVLLHKRGFLMVFEIPQNRYEDDEGNVKWRGHGRIAIYFDKIIYKLEIENSSILSMLCSNVVNLTSHLPKICASLKKLNLSAGNNLKRDANYYFTMDNVKSSSYRLGSIPIYAKTDMRSLSFSEARVKFRIKFGVYLSVVMIVNKVEIPCYTFFCNQYSTGSDLIHEISPEQSICDHMIADQKLPVEKINHIFETCLFEDQSNIRMDRSSISVEKLKEVKSKTKYMQELKRLGDYLCDEAIGNYKKFITDKYRIQWNNVRMEDFRRNDKSNLRFLKDKMTNILNHGNDEERVRLREAINAECVRNWMCFIIAAKCSDGTTDMSQYKIYNRPFTPKRILEDIRRYYPSYCEYLGDSTDTTSEVIKVLEFDEDLMFELDEDDSVNTILEQKDMMSNNNNTVNLNSKEEIIEKKIKKIRAGELTETERFLWEEAFKSEWLHCEQFCEDRGLIMYVIHKNPDNEDGSYNHTDEEKINTIRGNTQYNWEVWHSIVLDGEDVIHKSFMSDIVGKSTLSENYLTDPNELDSLAFDDSMLEEMEKYKPSRRSEFVQKSIIPDIVRSTNVILNLINAMTHVDKQSRMKSLMTKSVHPNSDMELAVYYLFEEIELILPPIIRRVATGVL